MYEKELTMALAAVEKACVLCQAVARDLIPDLVFDKPDKSPVTVADFGAQAVISAGISEAFPEDKIVGEEDDEALNKPENFRIREQVVRYCRQVLPAMTEIGIITAIARGNYTGGSGRFWTIDPVDGTKGFLRKEQYAVALALIEDGKVVMGVLGCPNMPEKWGKAGDAGYVFYAVKGQWAWQKKLGADYTAKIHTDKIKHAAEALFCQSVESGHTAKGEAEKIRIALNITRAPVEMDSQAKYAAAARGDASIYLRLPKLDQTGKIITYREKIWDHAAGKIIIEEAGGKVSDIWGRRLEFNQGRELMRNQGVIAASSGVFSEVLQAVKRVYQL